MNKKIKIIDLVNRIESGEEVPEKIKYNQLEFKYDKGSGKYIRKNSSIITWFCIERFTSDFLNKTVEILEDNTEEIEEIELIGTNFMDMDKNQLKDEINKNRIFINKLRQEIFELRKDKNND